MGTQISLEKIKHNLQEFQPDLSHFRIVQKQEFTNPNSNQNQNIKIWQHQTKRQRLIQKEYLVKNQSHYNQLLTQFTFRYNEEHLLATKFLIVQNKPSLSDQQWFHHNQTTIRVFFQLSITNLSYFKQIPQQDSAYFLIQVLEGFHKLFYKIKCPFQVKQQMIHLTDQRKVKVWLDQDPYNVNKCYKLNYLASQQQMIHQILELIKRNVYFTDNDQSKMHKSHNMSVNILQEILKQSPQNLEQSVRITQYYLQKYGCDIGNQMSCLRDLEHDQLINIMQLTRIKILQDKNHKNLSFNTIQNNQFTPAQNPIYIQSFSTQNAVGSFIYGKNVILPNQRIQNQILTRIQTNYSHVNSNQQRRCKISRSNSCGNKKSGISLVNKNKLNSQSIQKGKTLLNRNQNQRSCILLNPIPKHNLNKNKCSQLKINNQIHYPAGGIGLHNDRNNFVQYNLKNNQEQNYFNKSGVTVNSKISPFQQNSKSIQRNNSVRGLTLISPIVQKEERQTFVFQNGSKIQKRPCSAQNKGIKIVIPSQPQLIKQQDLTNQSWRQVRLAKNQQWEMAHNYNNNSSIKITNFPRPLISLKSTEGLNGNIISQNSFYNFSAFEPHLQNQSLTRFHKQFINFNNSSSQGLQNHQIYKPYKQSEVGSFQQFYENQAKLNRGRVQIQNIDQIPKVYIHSPKQKNQTDSDCFKRGKPILKQSIKKLQIQRNDFIKQEDKLQKHKPTLNDWESQKQSKEIRTYKQYQDYMKYINDKERLFTDPKLYQYIKNNSSVTKENSAKQQKKKKLIDHLNNVQISQSIDYKTAQEMFYLKNCYQNNRSKDSPIKQRNLNQFTLNDFPTIQEIQENPFSQIASKQNLSFIPIPLNLNHGQNNNLKPLNSKDYLHNPPSSIRRGHEQSMVMEYKRFYDDTNRSNNSPKKYNPDLERNNEAFNKYATANNWQAHPSIPLTLDRKNIMIQNFNSNSKKLNCTNVNKVQLVKQTQFSPLTKAIFKGQKPSINPLLLQDVKRVRQTHIL